MNWLTRLKPFTSVLAIVILLSGCGTNNKISQTEPQNTQISLTTTSSNQLKDTEEKSNLFGEISSSQIDNPETYYDDVFKFSVEYPSEWKTSKPNDEKDTATPDGNPERGISISVDNKEFFNSEENVYLNSIYVYHAVGHIDFSHFENNVTKELFTTTDKINGELSYTERNGYFYIYLTLGDGAFYGAQIRISVDLFEKNKDQVYGILKSIKIPNS
ncbi:hypothetical protein EHE19_004155 [Ruminiclostridium herbifermentans]|uniref:Lipoprotein n=1 Tax=Ruminiclostridium herbifermentans TaxID=2488810 RepID=A0A4U7JHQ1_9FIRM|nr:hypothetical protein [Ruminiclostridium herbifermentans]QNU67674.1 hypothetical protein EHE19_004155 [Ruminiclostridium herbifermentans]